MKNKIIKNISSCFTYEISCAYFMIINKAQELLSVLTDDALRQILVRSYSETIDGSRIIHELISPLIYLRLECSIEGKCFIHYGYEQTERFTKYYPITSAFIRSIYRYTAKEHTVVNIEDCIHTDWVVINCAELFEYVGDRNKFHKVSVLEYKPEINTVI